MEKDQLLNESVVLNDREISWREIDGEVLVLHKKDAVLFEMNATAGLIWTEMLKGRCLGEVADTMRMTYDVQDEEVLKEDLVCFVQDLLKKKYFLRQPEQKASGVRKTEGIPKPGSARTMSDTDEGTKKIAVYERPVLKKVVLGGCKTIGVAGVSMCVCSCYCGICVGMCGWCFP